MNGKASTISRIIVVCLAHKTIMKDRVKQLNKIGFAETARGIDEEAGKNRKV